MGESKPNPDALTQNSNLVLKAISEVKGSSFIIPYQQRGYKWAKNNITLLLDDLKQFIESDEKMYCLQQVAVAVIGIFYTCSSVPARLYLDNQSSNKSASKIMDRHNQKKNLVNGSSDHIETQPPKNP